NGAYKEIIRRLAGDPATTRLLIEAQKAWLGWRDAECAFASSPNAGGSMFAMVVSTCLETVTKKRAAELGAYLRCAEGEADCPVPAK
ncbi:MAG: lysozyme inhibitor LprI family protein, partial [Roseiarcus sp.]